MPTLALLRLPLLFRFHVSCSLHQRLQLALLGQHAQQVEEQRDVVRLAPDVFVVPPPRFSVLLRQLLVPPAQNFRTLGSLGS